uniref:DUF6535 domain-containing protein n=1 Tax=Mycena chlorophos TaxID=658473 RepID=A0ABQ0LWI9_MYCCL|nr:predicted protein [Mycena chlorophos]
MAPTEDVEKGAQVPDEAAPNHDTGEDLWASKMWMVYIAQAERYDKALVESWKSDMEGLVIFAALFSAILTAFIIESYTTLTLDTGTQTVQLLEKISAQMNAQITQTAFNNTSFPAFNAPKTSIICNSLWFMSLGLSLSCALMATFVQQWSRDFLHKTDLDSGPRHGWGRDCGWRLGVHAHVSWGAVSDSEDPGTRRSMAFKLRSLSALATPFGAEGAFEADIHGIGKEPAPLTSPPPPASPRVDLAFHLVFAVATPAPRSAERPAMRIWANGAHPSEWLFQTMRKACCSSPRSAALACRRCLARVPRGFSRKPRRPGTPYSLPASPPLAIVVQRTPPGSKAATRTPAFAGFVIPPRRTDVGRPPPAGMNGASADVASDEDEGSVLIVLPGYAPSALRRSAPLRVGSGTNYAYDGHFSYMPRIKWTSTNTDPQHLLISFQLPNSDAFGAQSAR